MNRMRNPLKAFFYWFADIPPNAYQSYEFNFSVRHPDADVNREDFDDFVANSNSDLYSDDDEEDDDNDDDDDDD